MANTIQVRRGTEANLPTLNQAEFGYCTDSDKVYIGDGSANHQLLQELVQDTSPKLGGNLDCDDNELQNILTGTFKDEHDNGTQGSNYTIDWGNGQKQEITLSGSITLSFTDPSGPANLILRVIQDGTGGQTLTWPGSVKWPGGSKTALTSDASAVDAVSLYYNGTNYYAQMGNDFS